MTQLQWRLAEGNGEALYELGVSDDGTVLGMASDARETSYANLQQMASKIPADVSIEREVTLANGNVALECLIRRRMIEEDAFLEINVAIVGGQVGKSTLLAQLTRGAVDDGRGSGRYSIARHQHERESGVTSSITHEILGYTSEGKLVRSSDDAPLTWEQITQRSSKIIHFLDTCGHRKYWKTTIRALTSYLPDYACFCIGFGKTAGVTQATIDQMNFLVQWNIPFFICLTRADLSKNPRGSRVVEVLENWIAGDPIYGEAKFIYDNDRRGIISASLSASQSFSRYISSPSGNHQKRIVPVFITSCVKVEGIDELHLFLNLLPKPPTDNFNGLTILGIEDVFWKDEEDKVAGKDDVIIWGVLRGGEPLTLESWRTWLLGPSQGGEFRRVRVKSIQRQRLPSASLLPGQAGSVCIEDVKEGEKFYRSQVRTGMVLIEDDGELPKAVHGFQAEVFIMAHPSVMKAGKHEYMAHSFSLRAAVRVDSVIPSHDLNLNADEPEDGEETTELARKTRGLVNFHFINGPEWINAGDKILITDTAGARVVGKVKKVIHWDALRDHAEEDELVEAVNEKVKDLGII